MKKEKTRYLPISRVQQLRFTEVHSRQHYVLINSVLGISMGNLFLSSREQRNSN